MYLLLLYLLIVFLYHYQRIRNFSLKLLFREVLSFISDIAFVLFVFYTISVLKFPIENNLVFVFLFYLFIYLVYLYLKYKKSTFGDIYKNDFIFVYFLFFGSFVNLGISNLSYACDFTNINNKYINIISLFLFLGLLIVFYFIFKKYLKNISAKKYIITGFVYGIVIFLALYFLSKSSLYFVGILNNLPYYIIAFIFLYNLLLKIVFKNILKINYLEELIIGFYYLTFFLYAVYFISFNFT